jgi:hypothetical protein
MTTKRKKPRKTWVNIGLTQIQECKLRHLSNLYGLSMSEIMGTALDFYCTRIDHYYEKDKKGEALRSALSAIAERMPPK